jgi:hypothetical protein
MQLLEWACDPTDIRAMGAAKALHEAVLPRCRWGAGDTQSGVYLDGYFLHEPSNGNPARAWLLAIFEALIAQEPDI